jgi:ABC-2 type transport system ATP-binding protein
VAAGSPDTLGGRDHGVTTVRFLLPPDVAPGGLPLPDGVAVEVRGGFVEFAVDEPTRVLRDLAEWALARGEELVGLTVLRPSLEDVYLALTGEDGS